MSFSSDLKVELSQINNLKNKQEVYAEFLGYMMTKNADIQPKIIKFSTENEYNINRFAKLLNNMNITDYKINITGKTFSITFKNNGDFDNIDEQRLYEILLTDNLKKAYIRGNFLGAGSINDPKNKYHLEIIFKNAEYAEITSRMLAIYGVTTKTLERTAYIKDGEEISKFLALIGGHSTVLKFEEVRVLRDMKNNVNRLVNCETANLNKTINASVKQAELIKKLKQSGKFNNLPDDLKEIANLREENPEATLEQLGSMLKNPIGKSSVSHRFKKIEEYL